MEQSKKIKILESLLKQRNSENKKLKQIAESLSYSNAEQTLVLLQEALNEYTILIKDLKQQKEKYKQLNHDFKKMNSSYKKAIIPYFTK